MDNNKIKLIKTGIFILDLLVSHVYFITTCSGMIFLFSIATMAGLMYCLRSSGPVMEPLNDLGEQFQEMEIAHEMISDKNLKCIKNPNGKYTYVDTLKNQVIPYGYTFAKPFYNHRAIVQVDGYFGIIDTSGHFIYKPTLKSASSFHYGMSKVVDADNHTFYLNKQVNTVPDFKIENGELFYHKFAGIKTKRGWGVIDRKGNIRIKPGYYSFLRTGANGLFFLEKNKKWGARDSTDQIVIPFDYEKPVVVSQDLLVLKIEDRHKAYNLVQKEFLNLSFDTLVSLGNNRIGVKDNRLWMIYDDKGNRISGQKFDTLLPYSRYSESGEARLEGIWYKIDTLGQLSPMNN